MSRFLFCRLPFEILDKILSYLDAYALFSMSHTNKLFYQLASNNVLWKKLYIADICNNEKQKARIVNVQLLSKKTRDHAAGYWKELHVKTPSTARRQEDCLQLPQPKEVKTATASSSTLFSLLSSHLFVKPAVLYACSVRHSKRSLVANLDMQPLTKCAQVIGRDQFVLLKLLQPGIIIGLWRVIPSQAAVFFLHYYPLIIVAKAVSYAEPIVQPPFDDIDPEYGLHGYKLHIVLHNTVCKLMSESFSQLFSHISDGWIQLTAISRADSSQHIQLSGKPVLPWRCEALQGTVENCCIMSLTLLDEFGNQFSRVTTPISMEPEEAAVSYDYDGEHYLIQHEDSNIQAKMQLVKMTAKKYFVVSLVVYVSVLFANKHFSRDY
uniref:F-box only protein 15-like n=1 Tax=Poecilia latipinna TaxID=48699 RepID=A0A3B3VFW2_9TELE